LPCSNPQTLSAFNAILTGSRGIEFTVNVNHQELAFHIGTVRELVSRNLSRLQASGVIKMDGRTITIPDLRALEAEVQAGE
jgi:CRP/FNR family transcriptional regulator